MIAAFLKNMNATQLISNVFIVSNEGVRKKNVAIVINPKTNVQGNIIPGYLK